MIHSMAKQMEIVTDRFDLLEMFKEELANVIKTILDNQNSIRQ